MWEVEVEVEAESEAEAEPVRCLRSLARTDENTNSRVVETESINIRACAL